MVTRFLINIGIHLLEAIFALGIIGSALVVILAGLEDLRETFKKTAPRQDGTE